MTRTHDATRREYEEDGYVIFRSVIDPDLIATANQHVDWLLERNPDLGPDQLGHELARNDPFWYRLVSEPRLFDIAEILVGPDIPLFATHYICKEPRTGPTGDVASGRRLLADRTGRGGHVVVGPDPLNAHCGHFDHRIRSGVPALSRALTEVREGSDYRCARRMTREGRVP